MFIPTTRREMERLGWDRADVILVSGDTYTDNSYNGTALVGHWLMDRGFRVGIIAQPSTDVPDDITRLGQPELFWSVSAGCVDSMVANYTPTRKFRKEDDFTPGGINDRRPDRACIAYSNLIKRFCKGRPIVLAGIEASLRRVAHYDFWSDSVRRSILFDAKADAVVYGMGELTNQELAERMRDGRDWHDVRGICWISSERPEGCVEMPSYEEVSRRDDRRAFMKAFSILRHNSDPVTASPLCQRHGDRWLVQNRPRRCMTAEELDSAYESDFENRVHPFYAKGGKVRALDTVKNSVTTHRGCYGDCSFCAISAHQGTTVVSRSHDSIMREVRRIASAPGFDGVIRDVGGPTANMYGIECSKKLLKGRCEDRRCLGGSPCPRMPIDHSGQIALLRDVSSVDGVRHVFIASGIRHDMIVRDRRAGRDYLDRIVRYHVSGQMKIAPEHVYDDVLALMGKPGRETLLSFKEMFDESCARQHMDEYLTYYLMAAHPGCTRDHMTELARFCTGRLGTHPEQVQVFTPTPSTYSTAMWWCGTDEKGRPVKVERSIQGRQKQKDMVVGRGDGRRPLRAPDLRMLEVRQEGRRVLRQEEGLLLRLGAARGLRHRPDIRLPGGRARERPDGLRGDGGPQGAGARVEGTGLVPPARGRRPLHTVETPGLREEEPQPHAHRRGGERFHPGLGSEVVGLGSPRSGGHPQLLVLLDPQGQLPQAGVLLHNVQSRRDIVDPRLPRRGRQRAGLRGVPRVPAPPPGLPPRAQDPRRRLQGVGARLSRMEGMRGGAPPSWHTLITMFDLRAGMEQRGFVFHGTDGEVEVSIDRVREMAARDDPDGVYALAMAYLFGWDVETDEDRGYELLEKAVKLGQTDAMALMVRLYMQGEYEGIDRERAAELAITAAKDGIPEAQTYAGLAYMDGVSVDQDYAEASRYLSLAANQGDQEARTALAYLYENGLGVEKNEEKAYKLYRTAARGGSVNAMFHAGVCCEFGVGTAVDLGKAKDWYLKGSQGGDAFAMERLGHLTMQDDPEGGFEWFLRAAMEGVPTAMGTVGFCYLNGAGTERDEAEARKWLKMAADNDVEEAARALEEMGPAGTDY